MARISVADLKPLESVSVNDLSKLEAENIFKKLNIYLPSCATLEYLRYVLGIVKKLAQLISHNTKAEQDCAELLEKGVLSKEKRDLYPILVEFERLYFDKAAQVFESKVSFPSISPVNIAMEKRPFIPPDIFSGSKNEDFGVWLKSFERSASANGWVTVDKLKYLPIYLRNTALDVFDYILRINPAASYEAIIKEFRRKFTSVGNVEVAQCRLEKRLKENNESYTEYITDVIKLCSIIDVNMPENRITHHILKGLDVKALNQISYLNNDTIVKVEDNIRHFEKSQLLINQRLERLKRDEIYEKENYQLRHMVEELSEKINILQIDVKKHRYNNACFNNNYDNNNSFKYVRNNNDFRANGMHVASRNRSAILPNQGQGIKSDRRVQSNYCAGKTRIPFERQNQTPQIKCKICGRTNHMTEKCFYNKQNAGQKSSDNCYYGTAKGENHKYNLLNMVEEIPEKCSVELKEEYFSNRRRVVNSMTADEKIEIGKTSQLECIQFTKIFFSKNTELRRVQIKESTNDIVNDKNTVLSSCSNVDTALSVQGKVGGSTEVMNIVLDTGCNINIIDKTKVPKGTIIFKKDNSILLAANGSPLTILGDCNLVLTLENEIFNVTAKVVSGLRSDMLLGNEFLLQHKANINYMDRTITLRGRNGPLVVGMGNKWLQKIQPNSHSCKRSAEDGVRLLKHVKPLHKSLALLRDDLDDQVNDLLTTGSIMKSSPKCINKAQVKQKFYYDKNRREVEFKIGDLVMIHNPDFKKGISRKKLAKPYEGPFEVVGKLNPEMYEVWCPIRGTFKAVPFHVKKLKKYHAPRKW
jgi:hypothetical protein